MRNKKTVAAQKFEMGYLKGKLLDNFIILNYIL